jgi:hypothetical protein
MVQLAMAKPANGSPALYEMLKLTGPPAFTELGVGVVMDTAFPEIVYVMAPWQPALPLAADVTPVPPWASFETDAVQDPAPVAAPFVVDVLVAKAGVVA